MEDVPSIIAQPGTSVLIRGDAPARGIRLSIGNPLGYEKVDDLDFCSLVDS